MMTENKQFGFIGFGLIGGSIARNLRALHPDAVLIAYNYNPKHTNPNLLLAKEEGTLNEIVTDFHDGFPDCDIIFLCAPVLRNISYLPALKQVIKPTCILTDVGSVKGNIHTAIEEIGLDRQFIGGHPMAGSEKTGYKNSSRQLLENAFYILTPTSNTPQSAIDTMKQLVTEIGAIPVTLPPSKHDDIVAAISHVPHIIAATLVNMVEDFDDEEQHMHALAAGGFKDITRIASSSPVMWENICLTNPDSIIRFLDRYISIMTEVKTAIQNEEEDYLIHFFEKSKNYRDTIPNKPVGMLAKSHILYMDIVDEKGVIATISTILACHDINLKNIGIQRNREDNIGVLYIETDTDATLQKAADILKKHNYTIHLPESEK